MHADMCMYVYGGIVPCACMLAMVLTSWHYMCVCVCVHILFYVGFSLNFLQRVLSDSDHHHPRQVGFCWGLLFGGWKA